ncbi:unnamed protein product [Ectocarpus sp. 6 AP-2014]
MRLRQEFLDALKECGASAAQGISSFEGSDENQALRSSAPLETHRQQADRDIRETGEQGRRERRSAAASTATSFGKAEGDGARGENLQYSSAIGSSRNEHAAIGWVAGAPHNLVEVPSSLGPAGARAKKEQARWEGEKEKGSQRQVPRRGEVAYENGATRLQIEQGRQGEGAVHYRMAKRQQQVFPGGDKRQWATMVAVAAVEEEGMRAQRPDARRVVLGGAGREPEGRGSAETNRADGMVIDGEDDGMEIDRPARSGEARPGGIQRGVADVDLETTDGHWPGERSLSRRRRRQDAGGGVVPVEGGAEAAPGQNQGAGVEVGNTGVWEHMEGEDGTPTGGTIMKVMIAGIEVSVPLPPEAFCAWKQRASPAGLPGAEDGESDDRGCSSRTQAAATATTDRRPVAFTTNSESEATRGVAPGAASLARDDRTRSSSTPRAFSSANAVEGIAEVGASEDDQQRPNADTTRPFAPGEDDYDNVGSGGVLSAGDNISAGGSGPAPASGSHDKTFAVGDAGDNNTGGQNHQRRRSSCQAAAEVTSTKPSTAAVEEARQIEDGTRSRRSSQRHVQLGSAPLDEALADRPDKLHGHHYTVGPTSGDSANVAVTVDGDAARNTPVTAATGAAGATGEAAEGGKSANADGKGGNEVYFASSSEEENENKDEDAGAVAKENTHPPRDKADGRSPGDSSADGGVFDSSRRSFGTWGSMSRIEEDQAAAAAASAFAGGVGWRRLRRDTVTALVRQLGRATAERDRTRQQPSPRTDKDGEDGYLPPSPPLRRRLHHHHRRQSTSAPSPVAAATAPASYHDAEGSGGGASLGEEFHGGGRRRHSESSRRRKSGGSRGIVDNSGGGGGGGGGRKAGEDIDKVRVEAIQAAGGMPFGFPVDDGCGGDSDGGCGGVGKGGGGGGRGEKGTGERTAVGTATTSATAIAHAGKPGGQECTPPESRRQASKSRIAGFDSEVRPISIPSPVVGPRGEINGPRHPATTSAAGSGTRPGAGGLGYLPPGGQLGSSRVEAAGFSVISIPSPAGQFGCSPMPRSIRQAALLMRGAIRSLVRLVLLNAWKRWTQNELPPLLPPKGSAEPPSETTDKSRSERWRHAGEAGLGVSVGEAGGKEGGGGNVDAPAEEVDAEAEEDEAKEDVWRRRQALLLSFVDGPNGEDEEGDTAETATAPVDGSANPGSDRFGIAPGGGSGGVASPDDSRPGNGESEPRAANPGVLAKGDTAAEPPPAWRETGEKGEDGRGGRERARGMDERQKDKENDVPPLVTTGRLTQEVAQQCSEPIGHWDKQERTPEQQPTHRFAPAAAAVAIVDPTVAPLLSPRSPESGADRTSAVPTPGSRHSRNSMQRQTFSVSSCSSSLEEWGGGYRSGPPRHPSPPYESAFPSPPLSPFVRRQRRRHPMADRRLTYHQPTNYHHPQHALSAAEAAYADPTGDAASPVVADAAAAHHGGTPPSIHGYGYRSPFLGVSDDDDGSTSYGGPRGRQCSSSAAASGAAAAVAATAAREAVGGWTRPVLEGGSARLAEDERNKSTPWRPPGSPGSANVVGTAVAATAAAAAAMARSAKPTMNPHRNIISRTKGGPTRQGSVDGRGPPRDDDFSHARGGWGDGRVGGGEGRSRVSVGGAYYEERLVGRRRGEGAEGFEEQSSPPATSRRAFPATGPSCPFPSQQNQQQQPPQQQQQQQQPTYLAPTASSRHKRRPTNAANAEAHPTPRQASPPKRHGRNSTRASSGKGIRNRAPPAAQPRPVFRPSGKAMSPPRPPSPPSPRTRKQSLERRESSQSPPPPPPGRQYSRSPQRQPQPRPNQSTGHRGGARSASPPKTTQVDRGVRSPPPSSRRVPNEQLRRHVSPPPRLQPRHQQHKLLQEQQQYRYHPRESRRASAQAGIQDQYDGGGGHGGGGGRSEAGGHERAGRQQHNDRGGDRGRRGMGRVLYPYGAVYSRSFDTGEFFYGVGSKTPVSSPAQSPHRWEHGGGGGGGGGGAGSGPVSRWDRGFADSFPRSAADSLLSSGGGGGGGGRWERRGSSSSALPESLQSFHFRGGSGSHADNYDTAAMGEGAAAVQALGREGLRASANPTPRYHQQRRGSSGRAGIVVGSDVTGGARTRSQIASLGGYGGGGGSSGGGGGGHRRRSGRGD